MIKLSKKALAINLGAGTIIITGFVSFMQTTFARPHVEACSTRYHRQISMQLDHDGIPLSAPELQAVANGQDEGVIENLTVAQFNEGPSKYAIGVKINKGSVAQRSELGQPGGVSLPWTPTTLEQPTAACLSYDVFLPAEFEFSGGGTLPGLFASTTNGNFGDVNNFTSNLAWHGDGEPKLYVETKAVANQRAAAFDTYERKLPRGKWIHVEQEVILNTGDQPNGVVRLWLNGRIESDVKSAWMRADSGISITGVAGEVYFGGSGTTGRAANDETVWLSPFVIRWN